MPYALIPDGYSLKKVTKLQKEAVNAKRTHENITSILSNPSTPQLLGTVGLGLATAHFLPLFIETLENKVGTLTDDFKESVNETVNEINPFNALRKVYGGQTNEEFIEMLKEKAAEAEQKQNGRPTTIGL
jgi:hypothetical protein